MDDDLEVWVDRQRASGSVEASNLGFTLERAAAFKKLGAHALPEIDFWILLLVQAGVAGECSAIRVTQSRSETSYAFSDVDWTERAVLSSMFEIERTHSESLTLLSKALRALAIGAERTFSIRFSSGAIVTWDGEQFGSQDRGTLAEFEITVNHRKGSVWGALSAVDDRILLTKILFQNCYACPVPIHADGFLVTELLNSHSVTVSGEVTPSLCLDFGDRDELPKFPLPSNEKVFSNRAGYGPSLPRLNWNVEALFPAGRDARMSSGVALFAYLSTLKKGSVHIDFVSRGTVVRRLDYRLRTRCAVTLVISGEDLQTDLTGFQFSDTEEQGRRVVASLKTLIVLLEERLMKSESFGGAPRRISSTFTRMFSLFTLGVAGIGLVMDDRWRRFVARRFPVDELLRELSTFVEELSTGQAPPD